MKRRREIVTAKRIIDTRAQIYDLTVLKLALVDCGTNINVKQGILEHAPQLDVFSSHTDCRIIR